MQLARPAVAIDPRSFGKRPVAEPSPAPSRASMAGDVRTFLITFACGFLFVSILIG
jgi:hypothetical protein